MLRWSEAAERNRERVAANAEQILNDTHYDRMRRDRDSVYLEAFRLVSTMVFRRRMAP